MKRSLAGGVVVAAAVLGGCDPGVTTVIENACDVPIVVEISSVIPRREPKNLQTLSEIEPGGSTSIAKLDPVWDDLIRVAGSGYEERFTLPDVEDEFATVIEGDECPPG